MANRVNLTLGINADASQAKKELQSLQSSIQNLATSLNGTNSLKAFNTSINDAKNSAAQLSGELMKATNKNGGLDLAKLANQWKQSGKSLEYYKQNLSTLGPEGQRAFQQLSTAIYNAQKPVRELDGLIGKFAKGLANTAMWTIQSNAIHAFQSALSGAFNYAQKLNKGLTDIAIVSDLSGSQLAQFAKTANQMARDLSASTSDVVSGALIYYQAGLSDEEVIKRTETTIKLAQTSGESAEQISSYMTAIWNNFYDGSKSVEYYADAISYLGAVTAASNADIAEGMQAFAATAETVGLSFEYGAAALTTLRDITQQSASTIGNSLKTIFARLSSLKMGDTLEDGVDLTKYTKALESVGVEVLDANGQLLDMDNILDNLADKWDLLSSAQKAALAQTVGGVRQYNNLISLMDNYERFQELVSGSRNSDGYLQNQADEYAESWEAAQNRVRAAWQRLYDVLINDKAIIKITDAFGKIVNFVTAIIEKAGGLKTLLPMIVNLLSIGINDNLAKINNRFKEIISNTITWSEQLKQAEALRTSSREYVFGFENSVSYNDQDPLEKQLFGAQDKYLNYLDEVNRLKNLGLDDSSIAVLDIQAKDLLNTLQSIQTEIENINNNLAVASRGQYFEDFESEYISNIAREKKDLEILSSNFNNLDFNDKNAAGNWLAKVTNSNISENLKNEVYEQSGDVKGNANLIKSIFERYINEKKDELDRIYQTTLEQNGLNENGETAEQNAAIKENKEAADEEFQASVKMGEGQALVKEKTDMATEAIDKNTDFLRQQGDALEKNNKSIGSNVAYIVGAVNGLVSLSNALGAVADGIGNIFSGKPEEGFKQLGSGILAAAGAFATLLTTIERSPALLGLFGGKSALVPHLLAITGIIFAIVSIIKGLNWLINRETNALRENSEEIIKNNEKILELSNSTQDLSESVLDLVESYEKLKETGESTFDTVNDLREQVPGLIKEYEKLGNQLNDDKFDKALNHLRAVYDAENWEEVGKTIQWINSQVSVAQKNANIEDLNASRNLIGTSDGAFGKVNNGEYKIQGEGFGKIKQSDWENIQNGNSGLSQFLTKSGANLGADSSIPLDQMPQYYEALGKALKELAAEGKNNTEVYKNLRKEFDALTTNVEKYKETAESAVEVFKQDFAQNGFDNAELNQVTSMADFINRRGDMLEAIRSQYSGTTNEQAEDILRTSIFEKIYKKWVDEVTVQPKSEEDDDVKAAEAETLEKLKQLSNWYDTEVPDEYKRFALQMDIDAENLDSESLNASLMEAVETWRKGQYLQEAENRGLDLEELQDYADYLADIADEDNELADANERLSDDLKENSDAAALVARSVMSMNQGVEKLKDNFDNWNDVLRNSSKESKEYYEALTGTKDAIADLFEISKEFVSNDFISQHLDEIEKAATGDEEAIKSLRDALLDDIIINVVTENNKNLKEGESLIDLESIQDQVAQMRKWLDEHPIEVGTRFDMKNLTEDQEEFVNLMNKLIVDAHMTAEQANAAFDAIGFEATFKTVPQEVKKVGYSTITSSRIIDSQEFPIMQNGEKTGSIKLPAIETFTTAGTPYEYTDYVDAIAMETHPEGEEGKTPQIESITKKATPSFNNSSNSNKGGNSGHGGGSSHHRTPKAKDEDRYHEINQKLKQTEHELNKVNTLKDRSYGRGRLNAMDEEIKLLEREAEQYKELYKEAEHWFALDKSALVNFGASFNPDGTIANYQAWQESWIDRYNNESISEEEFSAWQKAVQKYEDSLQHLNEAEEKYIQKMNQIYDEHLEKVVYRVEYLNELIELSTDYLDYLIEKLDEDMYDTAETVAKMGEKASNILEQVNNIQQGIFDALTDKNNHPKLNAHQEIISEYLKGERDLQDVLNNIGQLTDKEQEQLREWMGQLIDYNKELRKTQKEAYDKIIESIEEFNDKIERQQDIVNDTAGVMEHYANIIDIIGKDTIGISDAMMNALNDLQVTAAQSNLTIALTALNENRDALAKIQKDLAEARKQQAETDDELRKRALENDIKYLEEAMEQQEDIVRDLAEEWASAYEDALKSAQDAFTNGVKLATEAFDKAVSGSIGSLDKLQDFYDKQTTLQDIFLPDYERIHDLSKLARDINNAINATDNIKGKERLRNLQNEILEAQREGTELSKYDMEFMQKRFELEQAQIAMEEQRNAKNLVRMTRDNEGNWSYTYTQNPEDMAKAQQEFEDKLYDLEKLNQDRVKETQQLMLNAMEKFRDEIANADMNDQEKTQALLDYWRQLQEEYGNLTDTALKDGKWITDTYDVSNHELTDSFEETLLSLGTGYQTLEDFMNDFRSASATMGDDVAAQYQKWGDYVKTITEAAGINFDNFAQRVADDMDLVIAAMIGEDGNGGAVGVAKQLADEMGISIDDILKELRTWWDGPEGRSFIMEAEITENEKTYEQLEKLIKNADQIPVELPKISQAVAKIASGGDGGHECGCGATCTTTCWTDCGSNGASQPRSCGCGGNCSGSCKNDCKGFCIDKCGSLCSDNCTTTCQNTPSVSAKINYNDLPSTPPWLIGKPASGATGMYTGAWGDEGKLAILHEKELVLNKEDTANMLATVGFVRNLVEMIGVNATSSGGIGNLLLGGVGSGGNYLDQNVTIHAEFPNATNHSEIEEAFQNLIGLAGQYAGRKQ